MLQQVAEDLSLDVADRAESPSGDRDVQPDDMDLQQLSDALLEAFVTMATRSKRRQADLSAALQRSGIKASQWRLSEALQHLQASGCIREIVPLYDGGTLVTVTNMGMDRTGRSPHWLFL